MGGGGGDIGKTTCGLPLQSKAKHYSEGVLFQRKQKQV